MTASQPRLPYLLATLLTGLILLPACSKSTAEQTAGQRVDQAVLSTERAADQAGEKAREVGRDAKQVLGEAGDSIANTSRDVAITAGVKSRLAGNQALSAMDINVDTVGARVVLRGTAPDSEARARATELARTVEGVRDVTNELALKPAAP